MLRAPEQSVNDPSTSALPPCPSSIANKDGYPLFGSYQGSVAEVDLSMLRGPYRLPLVLRPFKHKRWQYGMVGTKELLAVFSVADLTYAANSFAAGVDLRTREVLFDSSFMGLPGLLAKVGSRPGEGARSEFWIPGAHLSFSRKPGQKRYELSIEIRSSRLGKVSCRAEIQLDGVAPSLTAIAPLPDDGVINVTQKWAALPTTGNLSVGDRNFSLDGGAAGLDYSHGYLARHTVWRWAMATGYVDEGTPVGLNLAEGFNEVEGEASENVLWFGQRLIPLKRAQFSFDKQNVLRDWRVITVDGAVELIFHPIQVHREERNYGVVRSHLVQPLGTFEGTIKLGREILQLQNLAGVVEDQDVVW
jgi:hypothetical protein